MVSASPAAGILGTGLTGASCDTACWVTDALLVRAVESTAMPRQFNMNNAANTVVALERKLAAPRPPNTDDDIAPPAIPARPPPFELCSKMTTTINTEMIICNAMRIP